MKNKAFWHNLRYMYFLQGINYAVPLMTIPYLIRVLGLEQFGLISFIYAFINYFVVITNFGFQLSGTQKISVNRKNSKHISELFSAIIIIKFFLFTLSFIIFFIIIYICPKFSSNAALYFVGFIAVLGNVIFPNWYFMGMERMKFITFLNTGSRVLCLLGIFIFVKSKSDVLAAVLFQSSAEILCGIVSFFIIKYTFFLKFHLPSLSVIVDLVNESWDVFLSQIYITMLTCSNTFILGMFASKEIVGIYVSAEKIVRAVVALTVPVNTTVFPIVSNMFKESREKTIIFLKTIFINGTLIFLCTCLMLFLSAEILVFLITGSNSPEIIFLVKIMAIIPLITFIYNFYGNNILLNLSMRKEFVNAVFYSGLFSIALSLIFVPFFQQRATASIFIISELLIMVLMILPAHRKGINLVKNTGEIV